MDEMDDVRCKKLLLVVVARCETIRNMEYSLRVHEIFLYINEICSEISTTEIKDHKLKETPLMNFKINAPNQLTN